MTDYLPPLIWTPSPNFNSRGGVKIDQVIIHDEEGTFSASDTWLEEAASHVSAHLTVRDDGALVHQLVAFENRAWHACAANSRSIGIEMAGFSKNGFSEALKLTTARICAYLCNRFAIPIHHAVGGVGAGIELHWGLGVAGGHHFDPSTDPQWIEDFVALVKVEHDDGHYPAHWEPDAPPVMAPSRESSAEAASGPRRPRFQDRRRRPDRTGDGGRRQELPDHRRAAADRRGRRCDHGQDRQGAERRVSP